MELDDVWVDSLTQDFYLSVGTLSISGMLESVKYFFEGVNLFGEAILHFPNMPVGSRPNFLDNIEFPQNVTLDMACLGLVHCKFIIILSRSQDAYNFLRRLLRDSMIRIGNGRE